MNGLTLLDIGVLVAYLVGITAWGSWLGRGQSTGADYFLGGRALPWGAVMLSVVATETSTLTFLSIPGVAYVGSLVFLQLTLGYLVGRIAVALILLPAYYRGAMSTAYALLEARFGVGARRLASATFMVTRLMADSVRLFATAIPLALITGWPYPLSIALIGVVTLVYTYFGGIKAVVWVDTLQMGLYLVGAGCALVALERIVPGGWSAILAEAAAAGKLDWLDLSFDWSPPYTLWAGVIGGGFLAMASHGTDQLIVQRLLTCRDLTASRKALVGSGVLVILQFGIFLIVGIGLWAFYKGAEFQTPDVIFATFIIEELPVGITGLLIAGVFAAAMSSLSSSINSLASASAYDFWAPLSRAEGDDIRILRAGRVFTLLWASLLIAAAVGYVPLSDNSTAVEVALTVASLVYGGLLGAFFLGIADRRATARGVIVGMTGGIGIVTWIWLTAAESVGFPWFVPIGALATTVVGAAISRVAPGGRP